MARKPGKPELVAGRLALDSARRWRAHAPRYARELALTALLRAQRAGDRKTARLALALANELERADG